MKILRRLILRLRSLFKARRESNTAGVDFQKLSGVLGYEIRNTQIFYEALSHRSYLQSNNAEKSFSNERLEFLGDSILNLVVGEYLFKKEPSENEGELTKLRSRLVNRNALSIYARHLGLMEYVLMSPSAAQASERGMETILSDAFEAIIGAVYLDGGYQNAKQFIERCLIASVKCGVLRLEDDNYKSQLLERAQASGYSVPRYVTISEKGPDHDRTFTIEVVIGEKSYGFGVGKNKKAAEQDAAKEGLMSFNPDSGQV